MQSTQAVSDEILIAITVGLVVFVVLAIGLTVAWLVQRRIRQAKRQRLRRMRKIDEEVALHD